MTEVCNPEIKAKIDIMHKEIYGDGNSKNSLVSRISKFEEKLSLNNRVTWAILALILSTAVKIFFFS